MTGLIGKRESVPGPISQQDIPPTSGLTLIDVMTGYRHVTFAGEAVYEYWLATSAQIQNCGGYLDKLRKIRSPEFERYVSRFLADGKPPASVESPAYCQALVNSRSFQVDSIVIELLAECEPTSTAPERKLVLLDHGCTVAEHFDLLDLLSRIRFGADISSKLEYVGTDVSGLVLAAAHVFHSPSFLRLIQHEGTTLPASCPSPDLLISLGVVNHTAAPAKCLSEIARGVTRFAVLLLWMTDLDQGFWALNHSGIANYFFSTSDIESTLGTIDSSITIEFRHRVDEACSSQPMSYYGLSRAQEDSLYSCIVVLSKAELH